MKNALLKLIAIAAMSVAGITAAQAQITAGPNGPATFQSRLDALKETFKTPRKAVPPGYVITPFGYFHPSCVVRLAEKDELRPDQHVIRHANGTSAQMHECAYPHYRADGESVFGVERGVKDLDISHAWIEYASVTTTSSFGAFFAEWSVPPNPNTNDGQTLFFFPGLEDLKDTVTIIQPVLGWNADFPSAWGIAAWNCCVAGTAFEAPPAQVSSGDTILGYMWDTCAAGTLSCSSWDIVIDDLTGAGGAVPKFSQLINTSSFKQTFNWAFGGVLEVYNIKQCSDYPNSDAAGNWAISFHEILLFDDQLALIANPNWSVSNVSSGLTPQCEYGGSLPNEVILKYGSPIVPPAH
jgi:hypothetical protein